MLTHSRGFSPSVKGSSLFTETSEQAEVSKVPSRSFFDASSSLDLLPKSRFLYILSKYLAISISKYIQQDVNTKYNLYRIYFKIYLFDNSFRLKHMCSLRYHSRKDNLLETCWKFTIISNKGTLFRKEAIEKFGLLLKVYYEVIFVK